MIKNVIMTISLVAVLSMVGCRKGPAPAEAGGVGVDSTSVDSTAVDTTASDTLSE